MTEIFDGNTGPGLTFAPPPLPMVVKVTEAFSSRLLPPQRLLDVVARLEPDRNFAELAQAQPFRLVAFRALMRDFPDDDPARLWLHAYDVEVEIEPADPTGSNLPTIGPPSSDFGA